MAVPSNWRCFVEAAGGAYYDVSAHNGEPFVWQLTYKNVDYTAVPFEGGVRAAYEESSTQLQSFTFDKQLVGAHTVVTVSITEAGVEALRSGADAGAIEALYYSIKCTPPGGSKQTHFAGFFNLQGL